MRTATPVCVLAALLFASGAGAQYQEIYEVELRPDGVEKFEHLLARLGAAAEETASARRWMTFEVVTGKSMPTYRIVIPFTKWAERDSWESMRNVLSGAYGDDEAARLWKDAQRATESSTSQLWQHLPDSDSHPRTTVADFYDVYVREVRAGTESEIRDLHRKFKQAYDEAPSQPSVTRSVLVFGRNQGLVFLRAEAFDRWADKDDAEARGILGAHFGADDSRAMVDTVRGAAVWTDHFVSRLRRTLSRLPEE